jgi:hypothetical protein
VPLRLTQDSAQSRNAGLLAKNRKQSTPRNFVRTRYPKNTCEKPSNPFFPPSHDLVRLPHDSIPLPHKDLNIAKSSFFPQFKLPGVRTMETIQFAPLSSPTTESQNRESDLWRRGTRTAGRIVAATPCITIDAERVSLEVESILLLSPSPPLV